MSAPQLAAAVAQARPRESRGVIIDLTATEFLSSAGMTALVDARMRSFPLAPQWSNVSSERP